MRDYAKIDLFSEINNSLSKIEKYSTPPNKMFIVVDEDNPKSVIAYCAALHINDRQVELKNVVCDPVYQGQGLGKMLMNAFDTHAKSQGYLQTILWTYDHFQIAIKIYEKLGYVREEVPIPDDIIKELNPIYMVRDL